MNDAAFSDLVNSGTIRAETLVWRPGLAEWQPWASIRPLVPTADPVGPPVTVAGRRFCAECGRDYPIEELAAFGNAYICATCKPTFAQKLREGITTGRVYAYGGFWIRFLAVVVDSLIMWVASLFYTAPIMLVMGFDPSKTSRFLMTEGILVLLSMIVGMLYETFFVGRYGATPGKMICHLKVIRSDGSKLTYGRALGRYFAKALNSFTLLIGYIIAGIDEEKRALHDRICDTRVIRV